MSHLTDDSLEAQGHRGLYPRSQGSWRGGSWEERVENGQREKFKFLYREKGEQHPSEPSGTLLRPRGNITVDSNSGWN